MDEPEGRRIATDLVAFVEDPADLLDELLGGGVREDPIRQARSPADRGFGTTTDQHGDPRGRGRPDGQCRQVVDGAGVGERFAAPGLRQDLQDLCHRRATTAGIGAESFVFDLGPAEPEPQHQPTVAQELDGRGVLGQAERVMERREDDARPEFDPRGRLCERRADDEQRGHVAVVDEMVFGRPDRGEPEPLGLDRQPRSSRHRHASSRSRPVEAVR